MSPKPEPNPHKGEGKGKGIKRVFNNVFRRHRAGSPSRPQDQAAPQEQIRLQTQDRPQEQSQGQRLSSEQVLPQGQSLPIEQRPPQEQSLQQGQSRPAAPSPPQEQNHPSDPSSPQEQSLPLEQSPPEGQSSHQGGGSSIDDALGELQLSDPPDPSAAPLEQHPESLQAGTASEPTPEPSLATQRAAKSQEIWNEAFDLIEKDEETAEIAKAYLAILNTTLGDGSLDANIEEEADEEPAAIRQRQMIRLVDQGKIKIKKSSKITNAVKSFVESVLEAKPLGDFVIKNVPQAAPAALPWACVCGALEIMCKPANANKDNLEGVQHVVSRMEWYCALTDLLLDSAGTASNPDFAGFVSSLREQFVSLYKMLLIFLMQSVCSYYKNQFAVALKSMFGLNDWRTSLDSIKDAESKLQSNLSQYSQTHQMIALQECSDRAKVSMGLLGDISKTIKDYVDDQQRAQREEKDEAILKALFVVDPRDAMDALVDRKEDGGGLFIDSFKWILDIPEFQIFTGYTNHSSSTNNPDGGAVLNILPSSSSSSTLSRVFWVKGQPGTGKTMLLVGIIRELSSHPATFSPSISFFFFDATDAKLISKTAVLRSLLWMLFFQQPRLLVHMRDKYDTAPASFDSDIEFTGLCGVFKKVLSDKDLTPVYFIIDALDECTEGLHNVIELISTSLALTDKIKWLVSSRPSVALGDIVPSNILLEIDSQKLEAPVKAYIDYKLSKITQSEGFRGYTDDIKNDLALEINNRAETTFLWVWHVFHVLFVRKKNAQRLDGSQALKKVREMPSGLKGVYNAILDGILNDEPEDSKYCQELLRMVFLAYRPLSLEEIASFSSFPEDQITRIVGICGSFLSIYNGTVNLIHLSAKDYLKGNYEEKLGSTSILEGHADMSDRCLRAMDELHKNMYSISLGPYDRTEPVAQPNTLTPLRYACLFWLDHLCDGTSNGSRPDEKKIYTFLQKHFLHWFEALSLMWEMTNGIMALRKLIELFPRTPGSSDFAGFIYDALRLTLSFRVTIEEAPLQIYASVLLFSPTNNQVRRCFAGKELGWITTKPAVPAEWDACLQTLRVDNGEVNAVSFSSDGKLLATVSAYEIVKIWDVLSGACKQVLPDVRSDALSVAFSPNGKTLASLFVVGVCLFNIISGDYEWLTDDNKYWVQQVVFSPDGKNLASITDNNIIKIYDMSSREFKRSLIGHQARVHGLAFSPDGKSLVTTSTDNTVKIWDALSGECEQTIDCGPDDVLSAMLLPHG